MDVKYFSQVFANSGDVSAVPDAVDVSGGLSYAAGFNANFSRNLSDDPLAKAVPRAQFNKLMQDVTGAIQQIQQNGTPIWITSAMNNGVPFPYAAFSRVLYSDGHVYESLVRANTLVPTNDGINWKLADASAATSFSTGDVKLTMKTAADSGWIMCNDGSIGSASSAATSRANSDTLALYSLLWANVPDAYAPVSGGRGLNANSDFYANKTIKLTAMLGRALAISGNGLGLSAYALGQAVGENTHVLTQAETPVHWHLIANTDSSSGASPSPNNYMTWASAGGLGNSDYRTGQTGTPPNVYRSSSVGGDAAHNNMQPTTFLNAMIKL